jgi:hypothetical protein
MSDIAEFRRQQQLEEESARLGFSGPAAVASHEAINARMDQGAARLLQLIEDGATPEEIYARWDTEMGVGQ